MTAELAAIERKRFGDSKATSGVKEPMGVTQILNDMDKSGDSAKKTDSTAAAQSLLSQLSEMSGTETLKEKGGAVRAEPKRKPEFMPEYKPDFQPDADTAEIGATGEYPVKPPRVKRGGIKAKPAPMVKEPTKKLLKTVVIDNVPLGKPSKPAYLSPEEKERLQKLREEELLEKEMALEDPDEMLDSINPYDVKNIETPADSEILNVKITKDMVSAAPDISGKPLPAEIAENSESGGASGAGKPNTSADEVKEYKPAFESHKWQKKRGKKKLNFTEDLDITPVLESLNKSFAEKRKENMNVRRTLSVDTLSDVAPGSDKSYKGKTIPAKLNINYKKQIIEDSAVLPHNTANLHSRQLEERALGSKKKRKVRDFIFEDIDDDDYEDDMEMDDADEYDSYDSSDAIRKDLDESSKGLKWRFSLLLIVTLAAVIMTFVNDSGGDMLQSVQLKWFRGATEDYAKAFVFANLIAGVLGMILCSGVIVTGLKNLFTGRADCDSACAVPCVMTTVASIAHLAVNGGNGSTYLIQNRMGYVYVSVALCGLLFNTLGKIFMIERAKKNFGFISGDTPKYSAYMPNTADDSDARGFTKGILNDVPVPVFMRRTEFLTDYLKNSYCVDWADMICRRLVPAAALFSVLMGIAAYFLPLLDQELTAWSMCWAVTSLGVFISVLSPFSIMFLVNNPLLRAANTLSKSHCVVMGFTAAQKFSAANAAVVDAGVLFPAGSVKFLNAKRCQKPNAINSITIDESIVISASLAIKTNSIMSSMFYDMISGESDILYKIENPIYEVNMGITGWMGSKRVMLGNREQMKHHGVDIPGEDRERKHRPENADVVYLAVGSEAVAMFFIEVIPNPAVKNSLRELDKNGVVLSVRTKDCLVTVGKLADIFELDPAKIRILSFDQHTSFDDYSRYTSRGSSEIACNGTFTSFAKALVTAKTLIRDMIVTSSVMFMTTIIALLMGVVFVLFQVTGMLSPSTVIIYNVISLIIVFIFQGLRRY